MHELIEAKRKKNQDVVRIEDPERSAEVVDIMETLKRSLAALSTPEELAKKTAGAKRSRAK
jgi:non-homologous end joining protein Ku